jgi:hypothetical protein
MFLLLLTLLLTLVANAACAGFCKLSSWHVCDKEAN